MTKDFDPNQAASADSGIYGLPFTEEESAVVLLPVPWEVTTSYGGGTADGPAAIFEASHQLDLFDLEIEKAYEAGIMMLEESEEIRELNDEMRSEAQNIIEVGGQIEGDSQLEKSLREVNRAGERLNEYVLKETRRLLSKGKIVGVVGGDHSVPLGAIQAYAEKYPSFGILHIDAHLDLREAFEGFQWSHASIMNNVMSRIPQVKKLVQVGIRDFCEEEFEFARKLGDRSRVFYDLELARAKIEGKSWATITQEIVKSLPDLVYISFDIDGLDPAFCPHTGTPVAGGMSFQEACYLIREVARSGRKIIGFDLNEVAPGEEGNEWDANVGMRLLYKLCGWSLVTQGKVRARG